MSMLSETIDATKSAVSQLIGKLEEKGFVERYMAKGDRRVVCVKMTDGGKSSYGTFRKGLDGMFNQYVQMMGEDDTETVNRDLERAKDFAYSLGVNRNIDPFMTLSFLSLPVIPKLKLTTKGVFDVEHWRYRD